MNLNKFFDIKNPSNLLVDFGLQPVSNRFLSRDSTEVAPSFPLQLNINQQSGLIYLANPFPIGEIKPRCDWITCYEPEDHLDNLVQKLIKLPNVSSSSVFGAFSFKDDSTLRRLEQLGYSKTWRIDPSIDLGISDPCANVETYQYMLSRDVAQRICERYGGADVFIVRHVLEHAYDLPLFIEAIKLMVRPGGYILWEIPDCERALSVGDCTIIWEEHTFYFTKNTFIRLLLNFGFCVEHYESVPYPLENSLVAIVKEAIVGEVGISKGSRAVESEIRRALYFVKTLNKNRDAIRKKLISIKQENGEIAMFGAGHLSVAFISLMQVADLISYVIDDNPNKKGMKMPVGGFQIVGSDVLYSRGVRVCLLGLNPQNQPKLIDTHRRFTEQGGTFISIFFGQ